MSNNITVLDDRQHVLMRPGMYIGSVKPNLSNVWALENDNITRKEITFVPAFLKLFDEIISNSIDEAIRTNFKHANIISVTINQQTNKIVVEDNGRGIGANIEKTTGLPESVVAFTQLKAGSNFNDSGSTIGQNGVGGSCVNVFSKSFDVRTCDGKEATFIICSNNMETIDYQIKKSAIKGTKVSFIPDYERLSLCSLDDNHFNLIEKRVLDLSLCFPKISFKFNGKPIQGNTFKKYCEMFSKDIETFEGKQVSIGIFPYEDFSFCSFVNGIDTKRGGNHVNHVAQQISAKLREIIAKKYKDIKPQDIKNKMGLVVIIKELTAPRFDSQTKEELINTISEMNGIFDDVDFEKIVQRLRKNENFIEPIVDMYRAKEEIKRRKELASKEKSTDKIKVAKHIEALSKDRKKCAIHITEGDSAISSFIACRNKDLHAGYPLRGKFINVYEMDDVDVIKNNEVKELLSVMGLRLSSDSIDNLRYGKISILCDMDVDGDAIFAALVSFFYKYWPEIIKQKRLVRVLSPLITTKNGNEYFSVDEYEKTGHNEEIVKYNKGLGGLSRESYRKMINKPVEIIVTEDSTASDFLKIAFGKDSEKRKGWLL